MTLSMKWISTFKTALRNEEWRSLPGRRIRVVVNIELGSKSTTSDI